MRLETEAPCDHSRRNAQAGAMSGCGPRLLIHQRLRPNIGVLYSRCL
jgi:hypothetical protein